MDSKASISKSAINFVNHYPFGITLKSRKLKYWIKKKCLTQSFVASELNLSKRQFRNRLYRRKTFNKQQIIALVNLFGARVALQVIWFPSLEEKERVRKCVWEESMNNFTDYCDNTCRASNAERIAELQKEYGEDWEQSEDFTDYIFDTDVLPSRIFMRRRCDVR